MAESVLTTCGCGAERACDPQQVGTWFTCDQCGSEVWVTEPRPFAVSESTSTEWDQVKRHWGRLQRADAAVNSVGGLLLEIGCGLVLVGIGLPIVVVAFVVAWPILIPLTAVGLLALGSASHRLRPR